MKIKYLSWLPAAIVMVLIFYFSSRPAIHSNQSSLIIADGILTVYEQISSDIVEDTIREQKLGIINHAVRKMAHVMEYMLLSFTIAFHMWVWNRKGLKYLLIAVGISALYAVTDEIHQSFVPGRSAEVRDVIIDTIGALFGVIIFYIISILITKIKLLKR